MRSYSLFLLFIAFLAMDLSGQNKYLIEYNRLDHKLKQYQITSTNEKTDTVLLNQKPLLKKYDLLILRINEVNPFLYDGDIKIKSRNWESNPKSNSMMNMLTGLGLGGMTGGAFDAIGQFLNNNSDYGMSRGETKLNPIEKVLSKVSENIKFIDNQLKKNRNYENSIEGVLHDASKAKSQIIEETYYFLEEIEGINWNAVDKVILRSEKGLASIQIDSQTINYKTKIKDYKQILAQCKNAVHRFEQQYSKTELIKRKNKLADLNFTIEKRHIIGWGDNDKEDLYRYDIQFILKRKLNTINESQEDMVRFYSSTMFKNQSGDIVGTNCQTCEPILTAKGQYKKGQNSMPINVTDPNSVIFQFGAYGKWEFYNERGEVTSVVDLGGYPTSPAQEYPNQTSDPTDASMNNPSEVEDIKLISLGYGAPIRPQWVSGLYILMPFQKESNIQTNFVGGFGSDSLQFTGENKSSFKMALGTGMRFVFHNIETFEPSINLGVSYTLNNSSTLNELSNTQNSGLNYMIGAGIRTKGIQYLSFDLGIAFNQTTVLKEGLEKDKIYSHTQLSSKGYSDYIFTEEKWRSQLYLGVQFHF